MRLSIIIILHGNVNYYLAAIFLLIGMVMIILHKVIGSDALSTFLFRTVCT